MSRVAWYAFPEDIRRRVAPRFRLSSSQGRPVSLTDYRGRCNLVLLFAHGTDCRACRHAVEVFAVHRDVYRVHAAEVLIVFPTAAETASIPSFDGYPQVLLDPQGAVRQAYAALLPDASPVDVLLFVLDRYGAPYAALACPEPDEAALRPEVLEWLAFIEVQCPE